MASPYAIATHWHDVYTNRRRIKLCLCAQRALHGVPAYNHYMHIIHATEHSSPELQQLKACFTGAERHYWALRSLSYAMALGPPPFDLEYFILDARLLALTQAHHPELLVSKPMRARMAQAWAEFKRQNNTARCGTIVAFNRYWRSIQDKTHAQPAAATTDVPARIAYRKEAHDQKKAK